MPLHAEESDSGDWPVFRPIGLHWNKVLCVFQTIVIRHTKQRKKVRLNADVWLNNATQLSHLWINFLWLIPVFPLQVMLARKARRRQRYVALPPRGFKVFISPQQLLFCFLPAGGSTWDMSSPTSKSLPLGVWTLYICTSSDIIAFFTRTTLLEITFALPTQWLTDLAAQQHQKKTCCVFVCVGGCINWCFCNENDLKKWNVALLAPLIWEGGGHHALCLNVCDTI